MGLVALSACGGGEGATSCMNGSWLADAAEQQRRIDTLGVPLAMVVSMPLRAQRSAIATSQAICII